MKIRLLLDDDCTSESEDVMRCAACGFEYTHQASVTVYAGCEDSRATRLQVSPLDDKPEIKIDHSNEGNPSPRRQGITIHFTCEGCTDVTLLHVYQHKGVTFLNAEVKVRGN